MASLLGEIPPGRVATSQLLGQTLARRFSARGTCPVSLRQALQVASRLPGSTAPFWRCLKNTGELTALGGSLESHAHRLQAEGLTIDRSGKAPRVRDYKARLAHLL